MLVASTALALAAGGAAYAAIPGVDGTVRACYATQNGPLLGLSYSKGNVRLVEEGEACRSYERLVTWNQEGPPGDPGAKGDPCLPTNPACVGPKGDTGDPGSPGISGLERVEATSADDSESPKSATAICPDGKRPIGTGGRVVGSTAVRITSIRPSEETANPGLVDVAAWENPPTDQDWFVEAYALCAKVN